VISHSLLRTSSGWKLTVTVAGSLTHEVEYFCTKRPGLAQVKADIAAALAGRS
jgi:hypothetical protein